MRRSSFGLVRRYGYARLRMRAKTDPFLLGVALSATPALLVLQTLAHLVAPDAPLAKVFSFAFFAGDVAVMVALGRLTRSPRDRSTAIGTAALVAFVAFSDLVG